MNRSLALCLFAVVASSPLVHGQSCSGGSDGGMDATGNQCNSPTSLADEAGRQVEAAAPVNPARRPGQFSRASALSPAMRANAGVSVAHLPDRLHLVVHLHRVSEQPGSQ